MLPIEGRFEPSKECQQAAKVQWLEWQVECLSTCISKRYCGSAEEMRTLETVRNAYDHLLRSIYRDQARLDAQSAIGDH